MLTALSRLMWWEQMSSQCLCSAPSWNRLAADNNCRRKKTHKHWRKSFGYSSQGCFRSLLSSSISYISLTGLVVQTSRHIKAGRRNHISGHYIFYNLEERVVTDKNLISWSTCRYLLWFSPPAGQRRSFSATLFLHSTGMTSLSAERSKASFRNKTEQ